MGTNAFLVERAATALDVTAVVEEIFGTYAATAYLDVNNCLFSVWVSMGCGCSGMFARITTNGEPVAILHHLDPASVPDIARTIITNHHPID
ncbi:hypothetical protein H0194_04735 [Corynebacterium incognita]|uniref:Uncharacterized protein n=1 Tax=Corynebacterium incognita TaxID=2754725 RepID=A0A7G7CRS0_9CORY|nr:hypothetical protein [Corynebacterium incognita]QNE90286.1 hypothetical protein H0194_04735 [Corynebacterium incognita]